MSPQSTLSQASLLMSLRAQCHEPLSQYLQIWNFTFTCVVDCLFLARPLSSVRSGTEFSLPTFPQHLTQCMAQSRCSIRIYVCKLWRDEWMNEFGQERTGFMQGSVNPDASSKSEKQNSESWPTDWTLTRTHICSDLSQPSFPQGRCGLISPPVSNW